jgi:hypothetical protein
MRRSAALLLAVSVWATGLSSVPFAAGARAPAQCAGHTLRFLAGNRTAGQSERLEIRRGRTVVETMAGWGWGIEDVRCNDLTGDATPELIVALYSGGAHCCTTIHVFQFQPTPRWILNFAAGNAGGFTIQRDSTGRPALILGDGGLAYYGDLCFACSPSSLPLAACYEGTRFVECTRRFPAVIQAAVDLYSDRLKDAVRSTHTSRTEYMKGGALGVYAAHVLRGKDADGLAAARRLGATPEVMSWLTRQRDGVVTWFRSRPGLLTP